MISYFSVLAANGPLSLQEGGLPQNSPRMCLHGSNFDGRQFSSEIRRLIFANSRTTVTCSRGWHIINGYVIPPCADDTTQEELTRLEHAGRRIRRWTIPSERSRARLLFSALVEACIWKGLVCISPHDLYVSLGDTYVFPRDVRLPVSTLSFQSLAFILSLVHPPGDAVGGPISAWAPAVFLRRYAGPWPRLAWTRWVFFGGPWIQLHYHMRVFTAKL